MPTVKSQDGREALRAQLMQGEDDPIMLAWFAPEGQWDMYGPRQSLEMVLPLLRMLS